MTPFTLDQLAALLSAAEPIGNRGHSALRHSFILDDGGHKEAGHYLSQLGLRQLSGFKVMIRLAIAGLPEDFALEIRQQQVDGGVTPLFDDVINGRLPARAILDALREFLARRGQAADKAVFEDSAGITVADHVPLSEPPFDQQLHVLGEDRLINAGQLAEDTDPAPSLQHDSPQ